MERILYLLREPVVSTLTAPHPWPLALLEMGAGQGVEPVMMAKERQVVKLSGPDSRSLSDTTSKSHLVPTTTRIISPGNLKRW